ncbi:NUDIX hydrolase [Pseudalkalibacillus hwajinpoensis]|uniref:NUDIX hydrolase n=1 Tax=Guptibacillus hwajinpoensis TaxID=208199 RepID=A0A4U1MK61_9BACL|nr:NUDIX hydrolase [Pseudalkalibacillus hwajinpoensis]TKD70936.1 NUDIX hydrolase [Pseudalkalibacillus hwajinpoensis]
MVYYKIAVVVMVVDEEGEILLVKNPHRGWEFPGGYVDKEETLQMAAVREVREESGIEIEIIELVGVEQNSSKKRNVFVFKGRPVSGELSLSNETRDVGYFTFEESLSKMTLERFKERLLRCMDNQNTPFLLES